MRDLLEELPVIAWEADPDGPRFTYVNRRAEDWLGYPRERWYAADFLSSIVSVEDRERVRGAFQSAGQGDVGDPQIELNAHTAGGRVLRLRASVQVVRDQERTTLRGVFVDITDDHRAETETLQKLEHAEKASADAEMANRAKDEFLAILSHELRAPLGSILIWTQLMRTGGLDGAATARALGMIERSTETLEHIIDDLLDISRIIAGKFSIESRSVDLASVVEAAVESAQPAAEAKSVKITTSIEQALPPLAGDAARLQQVVGNLVSNAIKFTPDGGTVTVTLDHAQAQARIQVRDTGIGIPAHFLPDVFERFRQGDSTSSRSHRGLGLGLAIVRHLVMLHGGRVAAESEGDGQGSTFTVHLPMTAATAPALPARKAPAERSTDDWVLDEAALRGLRVMLVDDEEDARESLRVLLERSGAEVLAVGSAADALAGLERFAPHVLLSDIAMPEEDGYRLIRKVRALAPERGGLVPAAALTAYASREDRRNALLAGYQDHVAKPPDPARLVALLARLARGGESESESRRAEPVERS